VKRLISITLFLTTWAALVYGCATMQLPASPTPEQTRIAHCQDAMTGLALSNIWLQNKAMTEAEVKYWTSYRASVELLVTQYCQGGQP
jgi:hypothetical protein